MDNGKDAKKSASTEPDSAKNAATAGAKKDAPKHQDSSAKTHTSETGAGSTKAGDGKNSDSHATGKVAVDKSERKTEKKSTATPTKEDKKSTTGHQHHHDASAVKDSDSLASSLTTNNSAGRILWLCQRGDWITLDQTLRVTERGSSELSVADEVNIFNE